MPFGFLGIEGRGGGGGGGPQVRCRSNVAVACWSNGTAWCSWEEASQDSETWVAVPPPSEFHCVAS
ncbi:hypothetical protein ACR6C2_28380 [Streptomyces sp. INA 01156]